MKTELIHGGAKEKSKLWWNEEAEEVSDGDSDRGIHVQLRGQRNSCQGAHR